MWQLCNRRVDRDTDFLLQAIHHIFTNLIMEFYEEAMSLSCDLTTKHISQDLRKMLEVMYTVFQRDRFDYSSDIMPVTVQLVDLGSLFVNHPDEAAACPGVPLGIDDRSQACLFHLRLKKVSIRH